MQSSSPSGCRLFVFRVNKSFLMAVMRVGLLPHPPLDACFSPLNSASASPFFVRRLQEANDTLKAEVKRWQEVADERERDAERFKVNGCRAGGVGGGKQ